MTYKKLRRSGRLTKCVPILLIGSDTEGRVFSEETQTVVLSLHGAGVISTHKLLAEQELVLRSLETGREAEIRVVGEIGAQGANHTYGVAFADDGLDFWQENFPPPPPPHERPIELQLECTSCGETITLLNGDYEFDVCAIHGGLVRYCTECGFATVWKRPEADAPPRAPRAKPAPRPLRVEEAAAAYLGQKEEVLDASDVWSVRPVAENVPPIPRKVAAPVPLGNGNAQLLAEPRLTATTTTIEDRRERVRAKVNYHACVRSESFGEDIVMCIDMSRGGLGFRTKNAYAISTEVTVAVPFSPEAPKAPAIFVAARVVNIAEIPGQEMFRCGVMFLPGKNARARS